GLLRGYVTALILLRAALSGDVHGVRADAKLLHALEAADDPTSHLIDVTSSLERKYQSLEGLLVESLRAVVVPAPILADLIDRLASATGAGLGPPEQLEIALGKRATGWRPPFTTTDVELVALVASRLEGERGQML